MEVVDMCTTDEAVRRFIGLDIHKAYFVATGVNRDKEPVFGPQKVSNSQLERWGERELTREDAIVVGNDDQYLEGGGHTGAVCSFGDGCASTTRPSHHPCPGDD